MGMKEKKNVEPNVLWGVREAKRMARQEKKKKEEWKP